MQQPDPLPPTLPRGTQCLRKPDVPLYTAASELVLGANGDELYYRGQWLRSDYGGATHRNYVKYDGYNGMPPKSIDWYSIADAEQRYREISRRGRLHSRACDLCYGRIGEPEPSITYDEAWKQAENESRSAT